MGDMNRAFALGSQLLVGTPAATLHWLNYVEMYNHKPNIKFETPSYKTNQRWMKKKGKATTRYDEVTVDFRPDSTDFGFFAKSGLGPPVKVGHTFTFLGGATQIIPITAANSMYLTVAWYDGMVDLWWRMIDARIHQIEYKLDATNGTIKATATIRGVAALPLTGPPTPSYTPPPDNSPFAPWQTVLSRASTPLCITTFNWTIINNYDPQFCTPIVAPTSTTEAGLFPDRFTEGEVTGTYDIVYKYLADPASSFYNLRHEIPESWLIESTDPASTSGLGYTPTIHIELPNMLGTAGEAQRDKPGMYQHVSGEINYNDGLATGLLLALTNGATNYNAD